MSIKALNNKALQCHLPLLGYTYLNKCNNGDDKEEYDCLSLAVSKITQAENFVVNI